MSTNSRRTYTALKENKLAPKKKFGQNFLVNHHTADAIVKAGKVTANDTIIEVGVGLGALTLPLAQTARRVIGYEIDSGIVRYHQQENDLPENVTLIHQDILTSDFAEIAQSYGSPLKFLANLPYSISNPFIFKLIDNHKLLDSATIMLQKEVGDRLLAKPNSKNYGVPTVMLNCCARVEKNMILKPEEFHPRPKIDSVVVTIDFSKNNIEESKTHLDYNFHLLKKIVRTSFNQRRKTLQNSLASTHLFSVISEMSNARNKELTIQAIEAASLSPQKRPENLSIGDFISLSNEVGKLLDALTKTS